MELSKRLKAVAELVTPGMRLADVGTDHGYIPIALVQTGKVSRAIAMDINKGPLERAKEHIREHGLEGKIQTRLSDGLKNLQMNEADCMIAAGMGGGLVIRILSEERDTAGSLKELILQPQSEIDSVRKYLTEEGYRIVAEDMVYEDGKYYPMMKAVPCMAGAGEIPYSEEELNLDGCFCSRHIRFSDSFLNGRWKSRTEFYLRSKVRNPCVRRNVWKRFPIESNGSGEF